LQNQINQEKNKLNDNNLVQLLKEQIKKKDDEINELKIKLNNNQNSDKGKLVQAEQMTCVYFTSMD